MNQSTLYPQAVVDDLLLISAEPISESSMISAARDERAGAMVVFTGMVRSGSQGKGVAGLFYEAYTEMCLILLKKILQEAIDTYSLIGAQCRHRIGPLGLGETAVVVITTSAHRKDAYDANQYIIDRVKFELPIWKKENFNDGSSEWRHNCH